MWTFCNDVKLCSSNLCFYLKCISYPIDITSVPKIKISAEEFLSSQILTLSSMSGSSQCLFSSLCPAFVLIFIGHIALEHPLVLSEPQPVAMFSAHGSSSLDFMLYVYVPDVSDRLISQSDLNQSINEALEEAGIEIPFPQSDLHLKTVSRELQSLVKET